MKAKIYIRRERTEYFNRSNQVICREGWPGMTASYLAVLPWAQVIFLSPWTICDTVTAVSTPARTVYVQLIYACVQHYRTELNYNTEYHIIRLSEVIGYVDCFKCQLKTFLFVSTRPYCGTLVYERLSYIRCTNVISDFISFDTWVTSKWSLYYVIMIMLATDTIW